MWHTGTIDGQGWMCFTSSAPVSTMRVQSSSGKRRVPSSGKGRHYVVGGEVEVSPAPFVVRSSRGRYNAILPRCREVERCGYCLRRHNLHTFDRPLNLRRIVILAARECPRLRRIHQSAGPMAPNLSTVVFVPCPVR